MLSGRLVRSPFILPFILILRLSPLLFLGFGYDFGALDDDAESSELGRAFAKFFGVPPKSAPLVERLGRKWQELQVVLPLARRIPAPGSAQERAARKTMERIGRGLLREAKANAAANEIKSGTEARDLLSVLVRANLAEAERDRLTDEEVMGREWIVFLLLSYDREHG